MPTTVSSFTNDVGYITTVAWNDVTNKPTLFSGNYNDLTNKPDLTLKANTADLATVATTGDYEDLTNLPNIPEIPDQTNNSGKFLTTNGSSLSWGTVSSSGGTTLPSQSGNSGKFLTTDGTDVSWANVTPGETRISSIHYPDEDDLTVTLTVAQVPDSNTSDYNMSVYRDGVYLIKDIDYTFNTTTRVITFAHSFESEEVVFVLFTYLSDGVSTSISTGDSLPSQTGNSGKFLTTNGTTASWATLPSSGSSEDEIRISSIHYPASGATSITLTSAQNLPGTINKYALSIYRNGIYLNNTLDYTYNNSTGVINFTNAFTADEVVVVNFAYLSSDSGTNLTYLDLAGTQTMTGSIRSNSQEVIHIANVTTTGKVITAYDDNNNLLGKLEFTKDSSGKRFVNIQSVDGSLSSQLSIVTDSTNTNTYITGPSISDVNDNSNKLATTSYVHLANNDRFGIATERVVNLVTNDNNLTINPSLGTLFKATLNDNASVIINTPMSLYTNNGSTIGLHITLTDEDAVVSWPQNVKWPDDTAPDLGYINIITFMTFDGGVTWYASLYIADSNFPSA